MIKPASSACNLRCGYCFYLEEAANRALGDRGIMSFDTAQILIKKALATGAKKISFMFQGGEPTLAGIDFYRFFVKIAAAENSGKAAIEYSLQTNGTLINKEFAEFFRDNNFLIGLSLDGNKDINDLNRLDIDGRSIFNVILRAADILSKHQVNFNILSVVTDASARSILKTYNFFKHKGFKFLQFIPCLDAQDGNGGLSPDKYAQFLKTLFDAWHADYIAGEYVSIRQFDNYINILRGGRPENCAMAGVCGIYYVIESDGSIYPCDFYCLDGNKCGNITDANPFEANSSHQIFINESLPIHNTCRECAYYALCRGGCKRDRGVDLLTNKYCSAYKEFFAYAGTSLRDIARKQR